MSSSETNFPLWTSSLEATTAFVGVVGWPGPACAWVSCLWWCLVMISLLLILRSPDRSKNQVHQHREFLAANRLKTVLLYRTKIVVCSVAHHLPVAGFLLLRMHVSGLAVPVRILAMF